MAIVVVMEEWLLEDSKTPGNTQYVRFESR
mgnify:CR=1 FL=1